MILPHYNGRNKTFFYFSYEGFRNHTASNNLFLDSNPGATGWRLQQSRQPGHTVVQPLQFGTRPEQRYRISIASLLCAMEPARRCRQTPAEFSRGNALQPDSRQPAQLRDGQLRQDFVSSSDQHRQPQLQRTGHDSAIIRQDQISVRGDQQIGAKDRIFARYTGAWQPDTFRAAFPASPRTRRATITTSLSIGPTPSAQVPCWN